MRTSRRSIRSRGRSVARRAACPSGPGPRSPLAGLTSAPREAPSDLWVGDLVGGQHPQAPTVRLMRQARKEQGPAAALLLMDPSLIHDLSSPGELRILHNLHPGARADSGQALRSPAMWSIYRVTGNTLDCPYDGNTKKGPRQVTIVQAAGRPLVESFRSGVSMTRSWRFHACFTSQEGFSRRGGRREPDGCARLPCERHDQYWLHRYGRTLPPTDGQPGRRARNADRRGVRHLG